MRVGDGLRLPYRSEFGAPGPLLLFLHGQGEIDGAHVARTSVHGPWLKHRANANVSNALGGYFRVAPHLTGESDWNPDRLRDLVKQVREEHADAAQDALFVIGISLGGSGALDLVAAHGQELNVRGAVVCCPANIRNLDAALEQAPIYLFHGDGDGKVSLDKQRSDAYDNRNERANFRWVRVNRDWTRLQNHHDCWTEVIAHPDLYSWFSDLLRNHPDYSRQKNLWPAFANLSRPKGP